MRRSRLVNSSADSPGRWCSSLERSWRHRGTVRSIAQARTKEMAVKCYLWDFFHGEELITGCAPTPHPQPNSGCAAARDARANLLRLRTSDTRPYAPVPISHITSKSFNDIWGWGGVSVAYANESVCTHHHSSIVASPNPFQRRGALHRNSGVPRSTHSPNWLPLRMCGRSNCASASE